MEDVPTEKMDGTHAIQATILFERLLINLPTDDIHHVIVYTLPPSVLVYKFTNSIHVVTGMY